MKVISSQQMANIETQAYRDGASDEDFMEEAGIGVASVVHDFSIKNKLTKHIILVCGKGNNAGDAYVAGIHLLKKGYEVFALQIVPISKCSSLCQKNHNRFLSEGGLSRLVGSIEEIGLPSEGLIIDGIFGTGFSGEVKEPFSSIIDILNRSHLPIIAVDIPSGLNGNTGLAEGSVIKATETAFLGLPKLGFFLRDGWNHVGKLRYVDFGLSHEYIENEEANLTMLASDMIKPLIPPIKRNWHKYERGYVVGLGGSPGMPGAAILSSWASLCGGAGIVRLLHPDGMQSELAASPYELIKTAYHPNHHEEIVVAMNRASATFIGPGFGKTSQSIQILQSVLPQLTKPCVIDADALTILSEEDIPLPEHTILTPHKGELERLLKMPEHGILDLDFLQECQSFAETKRITLLLKGGPTFIFHPDEPIMVNPRSDPGMATAGSGDVLTGLLAAFLAQGLSTHHAAALGVYLHGIAGELAAGEKTSHCMIASDIIKHFPQAFQLPEN